MAESKSVVIAALIANGIIAVLKFVGFLLTGSSAMLSETYHSISDTGNQVFLLIGIRYSSKERTEEHPFGYGKSQFFYSFLVSVLLFGIAGWESAREGYGALMAGEVHIESGPVTLLGYTFPAVWVNYGVLLGAIVFEAWAFRKAYKGMKKEIREHNWSGFREAFSKTSEITTLTALTEDTIALAGLGIALFGVYLTRLTQNPIYDAVAALLIGFLLMGFALALAWENKRLLLGESIPEQDERELQNVVRDNENVAELLDFRTVFFGPSEVLVTADVTFVEGLSTDEIETTISDIVTTLKETNKDVKKAYVEPESGTAGVERST